MSGPMHTPANTPTQGHADRPVEGLGALNDTMEERFGERLIAPPELASVAVLQRFAERRVHRQYQPQPLSTELLRMLCAAALSAPSKSDLQQRDIVIVGKPLQQRIAALLPHMPWVEQAPAFLVFCANGSRIREVSSLRDKPFPNDHLDLFFNAVGDAAIALSTCLLAAEAIGLGACPISEIRNNAAQIDPWLNLPPGVIPFAGLCLGWPVGPGQLSPRLPLALTVHESHYRAGDLAQQLAAYDARRESRQPYEKQYQPERWGVAPRYGWSEQKARQYAVPQRGDFGSYVRAKGFRLE